MGKVYISTQMNDPFNQFNPYHPSKKRLKLVKPDGVCPVCSESKKLTKHHKIPKSRGGGEEKENIVRICMDCQKFVHSDDFYLDCAMLI